MIEKTNILEKIKILEKTVNEETNQLKVKAEVELRITTDEKKIKVFTKHIAEILKEEFSIHSSIKDDIITNIARKNFKNTGEWVFQLNEAAKSTRASKPRPKSSKKTISSRIKNVTKK